MQVSVVTLMVNPDEAERLTLASTEGKIQLALRNPLDKTAPATAGIRPRHADRGRPALRPVRSCPCGAAPAPAPRARSRPPSPWPRRRPFRRSRSFAATSARKKS